MCLFSLLFTVDVVLQFPAFPTIMACNLEFKPRNRFFNQLFSVRVLVTVLEVKA